MQSTVPRCNLGAWGSTVIWTWTRSARRRKHGPNLRNIRPSLRGLRCHRWLLRLRQSRCQRLVQLRGLASPARSPCIRRSNSQRRSSRARTATRTISSTIHMEVFPASPSPRRRLQSLTSPSGNRFSSRAPSNRSMLTQPKAKLRANSINTRSHRSAGLRLQREITRLITRAIPSGIRTTISTAASTDNRARTCPIRQLHSLVAPALSETLRETTLPPTLPVRAMPRSRAASLRPLMRTTAATLRRA